MAVTPTFLTAFCQFGVRTNVLWNKLASNLVPALLFCWFRKIVMGSMVQFLPQDVTAVLVVVFPATGKRAPVHPQDLVPFIPCLELDNQTLREDAHAFILPFWVQKAPFKGKDFHSILTASERMLRPYWQYFPSHNWSTAASCSVLSFSFFKWCLSESNFLHNEQFCMVVIFGRHKLGVVHPLWFLSLYQHSSA